MTDVIDTATLRALAEQPAPEVGVDGAHQAAYEVDRPAREALARVADQAAHHYACLLSNAAANMLCAAFGPAARRAVLERRDTEDAGVGINLLAVFDKADNVMWYDDSLWGTHLVAARDELAAYGDPVPRLDQFTKVAVEGLCEQAEDAPSDGYFVRCELTKAPGEPYEGWTVELNLVEERNRLRRLAGPAAVDGSIGPQRRLLTAQERGMTVQVLRTVVDALYHHPNRQIRSAVRVAPPGRQLLLDVAAALDPRESEEVPSPELTGHTERYERIPVRQLKQDQLFSVDGRAWYVCAVPPGDLFHPERWAVPVYAGTARHEDAGTIRLDVPVWEVYVPTI